MTPEYDRWQRQQLKSWEKALRPLNRHITEIYSKGMGAKVKAHIRAHGYMAHIEEGGGFEMIDILLDEEDKVDIEALLGTNTILDLSTIHIGLSHNPCWQRLLPSYSFLRLFLPNLQPKSL